MSPLITTLFLILILVFKDFKFYFLINAISLCRTFSTTPPPPNPSRNMRQWEMCTVKRLKDELKNENEQQQQTVAVRKEIKKRIRY